MSKFRKISLLKASIISLFILLLGFTNFAYSFTTYAAQVKTKIFSFQPDYVITPGTTPITLTFETYNKTDNTITHTGTVTGRDDDGNIQFENTEPIDFNIDKEWEICFKQLTVGCVAVDLTGSDPVQTIDIAGFDANANNLANSTSGEESTPEDIEECVANNRYIGWAVCGLIKAGVDAVDFIYKELLVPLLQVEKIESIDSNGQSTPLYKMWEVVRNISISASVAVILFILLGSQLSFIGGGDEKSLFSSYSIKKSLPRLVIAIALIIFSFEISKILVDVFNILGSSIDNFVNTILQTSGVPMVKIQGGTNTLLVIGEVLAVLSIGKIPGLISGLMLATALIGILATFVTLVLRKVLIYTAIVMAPIAFLINAIPMRHNQAFELWKDIFFKSLFLYPLISILLASSKLLSAITSNTNNSAPGVLGGLGSIVSQLTSILIALLPLMIVPLAFKVAGKSLSTINGILTQFGSGGKKLIKGSKWAEKSENKRKARGLSIKTGLGMNFFGRRVLAARKQLADGQEVDNWLGKKFTSSAANDPWSQFYTFGRGGLRRLKKDMQTKSAIGIAEEASMMLGETHKHLSAEGTLDDKIKCQVLLRGKIGSDRMIAEQEAKKTGDINQDKIINQRIHDIKEYQDEMKPIWNNGLARMAAALQLVEIGDAEEEDFMHIARMHGDVHKKPNHSNAYFVNHVYKLMQNGMKGKYPHLGFLNIEGYYDLDDLEKFINSRNSNQLLDMRGGAIAKAAELGVLSAFNFPVLVHTSHQYGSQQMRRATNEMIRLQHIMHNENNIQIPSLLEWRNNEIAGNNHWSVEAQRTFRRIDYDLPKHIITDLNMLSFLVRDNTPNANNLRLRVRQSIADIPATLSPELYSLTIDETLTWDGNRGTYVNNNGNNATLKDIDDLRRRWNTFMNFRNKYLNSVDGASGALTANALVTVQGGVAPDYGLSPSAPPFVSGAYPSGNSYANPVDYGL